MSKNFLGKILETKKQEVAEGRAHRTIGELEEQITGQAAPLSFSQALRKENDVSIISEIKKASPSAGVIRPDFAPINIAKSYVAAGTSAISILTDQQYFQGDLSFISNVRPHAQVPLLRKDFIIDDYQIYEARAFGADALLLIVAALDDSDLRSLLAKTAELGMEALVEVHDEAEFHRAIDAGAGIIGVNNRNLTTFDVDLATTERLAGLAPSETILVGESGISTPDDIQRMVDCGIHAMLVGSHFMRQPDPGQALRLFKEEIARCFA